MGVSYDMETWLKTQVPQQLDSLLQDAVDAKCLHGFKRLGKQRRKIHMGYNITSPAQEAANR